MTALRSDYAANAEWYAALTRPYVPALRTAVRGLLPQPLPTPTAMELGPGVGTALTVLADAGAESIFAVEPSAPLRIGLTTTVALDDRLASRVTILPGTWPEVRTHVPTALGAVFAFNVIGHLTAVEERCFLADIAHRLERGGRLLVSLQRPFTPESVPFSQFGDVRIGTRAYRTSGEAAKASDTAVEWRMVWELVDSDGNVLDRREQRSLWRTCSPKQLKETVSSVGLEPAGSDDRLALYAFEKP